MNSLIAIFIPAVPLALILVPGLALTKRANFPRHVVQAAAQVILWSICLLTLGSLAAVALNLPAWTAFALAALATIAEFVKRPPRLNLTQLLATVALVTSFLIIYLLLSLPFLLWQDGLPTGDSQKAIFWAKQIHQTNQLPEYSLSAKILNRDPVDFYTPGLHTFTTVALALTPNATNYSPYLTTTGFLAIVLSLAAAIIGLALAQSILPDNLSRFAYLAPFLILTNIRFLRYLREPGYHFQNIAGEVLLFGLLLLSLRQLKHWRWSEALLIVLSALALALTHQFSAFIAVFLLTPIAIIFLLTWKSTLITLLKKHRLKAAILAFLLSTLLIAGLSLGLHQKIPHLFSTQPHLLSLTPGLFDYLSLMGAVWLLLGLAGLGLMIFHQVSLEFVLSSFVILVLSQGPRLGIDIPPVRALFYSVIPLSISATYLISYLFHRTRRLRRKIWQTAAHVALTLVVIVPAYFSTVQAFTFDRSVRTNSTLNAEQLYLIDYLAAQENHDAVLTDDYNRRASSWLLLSGHGMFTRIAADLERQMNEASQSQQRYQFYLNQLDFEKIFSLGSRPETLALMAKHNIGWVTGITSSSASSFQNNPGLREAARAEDIILYRSDGAAFEIKAQADPRESLTSWLLRPSTLVNDIGDREDTFEHLPASLRATRLSDPAYDGQITYRTSTAPYIPLQFNVGQFVRLLWDKENTGQPDISVELLVQFTGTNSPLRVITPAQTSYPLMDNVPLKIPASEVSFNEQGFITLVISNPMQHALNLDLIALGLARVP